MAVALFWARRGSERGAGHGLLANRLQPGLAVACLLLLPFESSEHARSAAFVPCTGAESPRLEDGTEM